MSATGHKLLAEHVLREAAKYGWPRVDLSQAGGATLRGILRGRADWEAFTKWATQAQLRRVSTSMQYNSALYEQPAQREEATS